jgi:outer membrane protein
LKILRSRPRWWPLLALLCTAHAGAQTFAEAVRLARGGEPVFLGAKANAVAAQARSKQAFAGLLPQINGTVGSNANRRDYVVRNGIGTEQVDHYNSHSAQLNLTQPIYRRSNFVAVQQAQTAASQAGYQVAAAEQELLAKLAAAWFDTMAARDTVMFTERQAAATRQQLEILRRGADLGTASLPAALEARAKHEQALADKAAAEMEFQVKIAALEQIVGPLPRFAPPHLRNTSKQGDPEAESLDGWIGQLDNSPQVLAAARGVAAAKEEITKQRALYEPTLDLVGSYGTNSQQVGGFPGQNGWDIRTGTIGLQLSVPLFSGGAQYAKVSEAIALHDKARQDLEMALRSTRLAAKQAWYGWLAGSARHDAALQTLRSALLALRSAVVGIESGVRTELDRLQAVQQLEGARRDFNKARYDLIASFVRLKAVAGQLGDDDLRRLELMFSDREGDLQDVLASRS